MRTAGLALLLTLAACSSSGTPQPPAKEEKARDHSTVGAKPVVKASPASNPMAIELAADGLLVRGKLLPFGTPRPSAESAIGDIQGSEGTRGSSSECAAGLVDYTAYGDSLQLTFQEGKFVGWTINGSASPLRTAKGIGIGSPRQSLDAAYPDVIVDDSSLGLLFSVGDLVGLLDQDGIEGIVTDIWAGTVCLVD